MRQSGFQGADRLLTQHSCSAKDNAGLSLHLSSLNVTCHMRTGGSRGDGEVGESAQLASTFAFAPYRSRDISKL